MRVLIAPTLDAILVVEVSSRKQRQLRNYLRLPTDPNAWPDLMDRNISRRKGSRRHSKSTESSPPSLPCAQSIENPPSKNVRSFNVMQAYVGLIN